MLVFQMQRGQDFDYYIDAYNESTSSWLRWINCARHIKEQNVSFQACRGKAFFLTSRDIAPGEELLIYYGHSYAQSMGINTKHYREMSINVEMYKQIACWNIQE